MSDIQPLRKAPSQRNNEYTRYRTYRALDSMVPGAMGGRVANAAFVAFDTYGQVELGSNDTSGLWTAQSDRFDVTTSSDVTYDLTYGPAPNTLLVFLNGLMMGSSGYSYDDSTGTLTIDDALTVGDVITAKYFSTDGLVAEV